MGFVWDLYGICVGFVWDLYGICMGFVWDLFGICMGFVWDFYDKKCQILKIYRKKRTPEAFSDY